MARANTAAATTTASTNARARTPAIGAPSRQWSGTACYGVPYSGEPARGHGLPQPPRQLTVVRSSRSAGSIEDARAGRKPASPVSRRAPIAAYRASTLSLTARGARPAPSGQRGQRPPRGHLRPPWLGSRRTSNMPGPGTATPESRGDRGAMLPRVARLQLALAGADHRPAFGRRPGLPRSHPGASGECRVAQDLRGVERGKDPNGQAIYRFAGESEDGQEMGGGAGTAAKECSVYRTSAITEL